MLKSPPIKKRNGAHLVKKMMFGKKNLSIFKVWEL
jgi:hypothetical protein